MHHINKKLVEVNDDSWVTYNTNSQIKFKASILKSSLCNYSDAQTLAKRTITIAEAGADAAARHEYERNERVTFKNYAPFTDCISEINYAKIDNAKDLDVKMSMYNLIEYSDNNADV